MECDRSVETTCWCFWPVVLIRRTYSSRPISYRYMVTNQPIPGFLTNTATPPQAVWAYSLIGLQHPRTTHVRYEHPSIASLLIGAAQADLVSPGFEQSSAISNRSTLDFTLHCGEQQIVLPDDASLKRLYALRACHQMMMMMMKQQSVTFINHILLPIQYIWKLNSINVNDVQWRRSQVLSKFWYFFPILQHKNFQHAKTDNIRHKIAMQRTLPAHPADKVRGLSPVLKVGTYPL